MNVHVFSVYSINVNIILFFFYQYDINAFILTRTKTIKTQTQFTLMQYISCTFSSRPYGSIKNPFITKRRSAYKYKYGDIHYVIYIYIYAIYTFEWSVDILLVDRSIVTEIHKCFLQNYVVVVKRDRECTNCSLYTRTSLHSQRRFCWAVLRVQLINLVLNTDSRPRPCSIKGRPLQSNLHVFWSTEKKFRPLNADAPSLGNKWR